MMSKSGTMADRTASHIRTCAAGCMVPLPCNAGEDNSGRQRGADQEHVGFAVGDLDLAAAFLDEAMDQPGGGGAGGDFVLVGLADQDAPELGVEDDAGAFGAHDDLEA